MSVAGENIPRRNSYNSGVFVFMEIINSSPFRGHCYWASEASPTLGCSIEISRDIYMSVGRSVGRSVCLSWSKKRRRNYVGQRAHAQSQFWAVKSDPYYSFRLYARAALTWTVEKRSLRNEKLKANRAS